MDSLFQLPETPLTALQSARLRMDAAQADYEAACKSSLERGDNLVPYSIRWEHRDALACLRSAEAAELKRLRE